MTTLDRLAELEAKYKGLVATVNGMTPYGELIERCFPHLLAVARAAEELRVIERWRDADERDYAAAGQTYGVTDLAKAQQALDQALADLDAAGKEQP